MCWQEDGNEGIDNKAGAQYNNESATKGQKGGNSMRKIFALVLTLTLLAVPLYAAIATGVDLSGMSIEELATLKQQLDAEMLDRGMVKSAVLPMGTYTIGVDIPKGSYELSSGDGDQGISHYVQYTNESDMKNDTRIGFGFIDSTNTVHVKLLDGQILKVDIGAARIMTFAVQWQ